MDNHPLSSPRVAWIIAAFFLVAFAAAGLRGQPLHLQNTIVVQDGA